MMKMGRALAIVVFVTILVAGLCHISFAEQYSIYGQLKTDKMVYDKGSALSVVYSVVNMTDAFWTPGYPVTYHYEIYSIDNPAQVAAGNLTFTQTQYVGSNEEATFAVGKIKLASSNGNQLPVGWYRIWIGAVDFRNTTTSAHVFIGAEAAFRIQLPAAISPLNKE